MLDVQARCISHSLVVAIDRTPVGRRRRTREKVYAGYKTNDKIADMGMLENLKRSESG